MTIEIEAINTEDLEDLLKRIPVELAKRREAKRQEAYDRMQKIAQESGFTIGEIVGAATKSGKGRAREGHKTMGAIKYRDPNDHSRTWTGTGRKPKWVEDWLAANGTLDGLKVK